MPELTATTAYLKYIPAVYPHEMHFDWTETDYEITSSSRKYLATLNKTLGAQNQLTEKDFTKIIDIFEKLRFSGNSQGLQMMVDGFFKRMSFIERMVEPPRMVDRLQKSLIERIYSEFWQPE
jgi:hypothetical protein